MRQMQWSRTAADQYLPRAQQQGMATYGSDGLGAADFGFLFKSPTKVRDEFPQFPAVDEYDELLELITARLG